MTIAQNNENNAHNKQSIWHCIRLFAQKNEENEHNKLYIWDYIMTFANNKGE